MCNLKRHCKSMVTCIIGCSCSDILLYFRQTSSGILSCGDITDSSFLLVPGIIEIYQTIHIHTPLSSLCLSQLSLHCVYKRKCTVVHTDAHIMHTHPASSTDITFMTADTRELGCEPVSGEASFLTIGRSEVA